MSGAAQPVLLDTNVVAELYRPRPSPAVLAWMRMQRDTYLTSITVMELMYGVWRMPQGRRRASLGKAIEATVRQYEGRILSFGVAAGLRCSLMRADRDAAGTPSGLADLQIAAIAYVHGCAVATRNVKDFVHTGVALINPWEASSVDA